MSKATPISAMAKFHFGATIFCSDGEGGTLANVVIGGTERLMTYIGAKQGRFLGKVSYLPFESIIKATGEGVTVRAKRAELGAAGASAADGVILDSKSVVERAGS